ncbi:SAM-dependent methyltransferase [Vibrio albus]|uniref:SAM-dependent methyltransferase n=1 Tax=Vibrio albus TaxID=2200953 RepID=A0A2U3BAN5_9VIBR|nr:class I SAM-dependent methyltransferase [Vibrio albus]PWI33847.1 SAM-dependent methyltransferase [Vibrio albus]
MWDAVYDVSDYVYGEQPNDFLRNNVNALPRGKVLCLADGEGRNSVFLAKLGFEVTAVDLSEVAIKKAKTLAQEHNVEIHFIHADLSEFDLGCNHWDAIVSIFCHLPPGLRRPVHAKVVKALKTNGVFLAESYTPKQLEFKTGGPSSADMMYSEKIISTELSELNFLLLEEKERFIQEGSKHNGDSHVVQVIARKESD